MKNRKTLRHRQRPGPFRPDADPLADARHALAAGVDPERVVAMLLPAALRHRNVGRLHRLLSAHGAAEALERALSARDAA